ncbi:hypothetical protein ABK040_013851 [Willaertia magna]
MNSNELGNILFKSATKIQSVWRGYRVRKYIFEQTMKEFDQIVYEIEGNNIAEIEWNFSATHHLPIPLIKNSKLDNENYELESIIESLKQKQENKTKSNDNDKSKTSVIENCSQPPLLSWEETNESKEISLLGDDDSSYCPSELSNSLTNDCIETVTEEKEEINPIKVMTTQEVQTEELQNEVITAEERVIEKKEIEIQTEELELSTKECNTSIIIQEKSPPKIISKKLPINLLTSVDSNLFRKSNSESDLALEVLDTLKSFEFDNGIPRNENNQNYYQKVETLDGLVHSSLLISTKENTLDKEKEIEILRFELALIEEAYMKRKRFLIDSLQ